ncbi:centrosomin-like isoform X3 [Sitophilus oryzae]|uniref:Centrosomin-like isoform X3 n=1 Tax=Sitophilus oryzae TaxID=7048 RepID=A0A6J2XP93_SITOR|nr:centrosomin-like isoform X3 [Sitophilus oryzae]
MSFLKFSEGFFGSPIRESQSANNLVRSPSSPFCTSPSQLQEVTLDQDGSFSNTMRSPTGPMRGRTVKEFEEQLTTLKKENFNLKLRIYFLEEKMGTNFTLDKDNIVKKNIELQVEIANLQKDVKEKHDLFSQAVKALELEEEEYRKYKQRKEDQLVMLQQEVEELRLQMEVNACKRDSDQVINSYDRSEMLHFQIDTLHKECESKDASLATLNRELSVANQRLVEFACQAKEYEEKIERSRLKQESLEVKVQEQQKTMERLYAQLEVSNQRFVNAKADLEEEKKEREHDKKILERNQMALTLRLDSLHVENKRHKDTIRDMQMRLEAAVSEANKNQNLAVDQDCVSTPQQSTDAHFLSVSDAAAPNGIAQTDAPHVPVGEAESRSPAPSTPDGRALATFERLLAEGGGDAALLARFGAVKAEFTTQKQKIVKLKSEQLKACEIIKSMIEIRNRSNEEIARLKQNKEELERELEGVVSKPTNEGVARLEMVEDMEISTPPCESYISDIPRFSSDDLTTKKTRISTVQLEDMEIMEQYKILTKELEAKIEVLVETLKEKDSQMQAIRTQYDEILTTLEEKENRIVDLEFELLSNQNSGKIDKSLLEKGDTGSEKHSSFYKQELEEKNQEIERLNIELKKCTCYLQEIVNKELWEKNREIEKLHRKQVSVPEVVQLKKELSGKDLQLKMLKEKIFELGLDIELPNNLEEVMSPKRKTEHIESLQMQLRNAKEEKAYMENRLRESEALEDVIEKLKVENFSIREDLERCERLRNETNEVCSILGTRLEELAIFLDSLLKHKSVLGYLGIAKNKRLREIISSSLDMSRSFSMSLIGNPEHSLAQLSNITAFLNGSVFQELSLAEEEAETHLTIVPENISLTYESNLWKKTSSRQEEPDSERVISTLREQVFNLKQELRLRDTELNRYNSKKNTETEDDNEKIKLTPLKERDIQSESEAWSEPDRTVSRARIGLSHSLPIAAKISTESTEEDDFYLENITPTKKRSSVAELTKDIYRLEKELEQKTDEAAENQKLFKQNIHELVAELQQTKEQLSQAQNEKDGAQQKIDNLQKMVDDLSKYKAHCEANIISKDKESHDQINRLEIEKETLLTRVQESERQLVDAKNEILVAQGKLESIQENLEYQEATIKQHYESDFVLKLKQTEEVYSKQIKSLEQKCEAEVKISQENLRLVKEEYSRDYIKKCDVEKKLAEVEKLLKELGDLKTTVESYEETIKSYKEKEKEVRGVVQEYQDKLSCLKTDLEKTRLQYSETVLEKNKLYEENQTLSKEIELISKKEETLSANLNQIKNNLEEVSHKYDQQVSTLHRQKTGLELKISELESANAELHNRLVKIQTCRTGRPPCRGFQRQYSDDDEGRNVRLNEHPNEEVERAVANSSPDLGIESDHGRFSSLETNANNLPRPLLQTIELTESMNNLFEEHQDELHAQGQTHCCQKSRHVEQENNDLKQKLLRMKRALEETAAQLNLANQRKKQVEKTICKQIHKTSQVLRKAKANLDSGSESDVLRT